MSTNTRVSCEICSSKMLLFPLLIFLFITLKSFCLCFEALSGIAAVVGLGATIGGYFLKCQTFECCDDNWIHFHESRLAESLNQKLFGQHLAEFTVLKSLKGFFKNKNPKKALVMSFNGLVGSGKNYVSDIIANSTYKKGTNSAFVHLYSGVKDFPHKQKVSQYQDKLREDIVRYTKNCGRSLFIFDEIDKMPPGVLDALKPYIDYYEQVENVDYRRNVFIFLSNAGASSIVGLTLKFWSEGKDRTEITMKDIEPLINKGAFNENGGFQFSELLRSELVDVFVPFLPLEKEHVIQCIEVELKNRGVNLGRKEVLEIANQLMYFPAETELYSKSGCKRITQKVDLYTD